MKMKKGEHAKALRRLLATGKVEYSTDERNDLLVAAAANEIDELRTALSSLLDFTGSRSVKQKDHPIYLAVEALGERHEQT